MDLESPGVKIIVEEFRRVFIDQRRKNATKSSSKQTTVNVAWLLTFDNIVPKAIRPWAKKCRLGRMRASKIASIISNMTRFAARAEAGVGPDQILGGVNDYLEQVRVLLKPDDRRDLKKIVDALVACRRVGVLFSNNSLRVQDHNSLYEVVPRFPASMDWLDDEIVKSILVYIGVVFREDVDHFRSLQSEIEVTLAPLREEFQRRLSAVALNVYPDYASKRAVATAIQEVADRLGTAFRCPECGEPARLKCVMTGTAKTGVFSFGHSNTTHRGKTTMPALQIMNAVDKPQAQPNSDENPADGIDTGI